jgi:hypothetical protein
VFASLEGCVAERMELLFVTRYFSFLCRLLWFFEVFLYIKQGCPTGSVWPAGLFCAARDIIFPFSKIRVNAFLLFKIAANI